MRYKLEGSVMPAVEVLLNRGEMCIRDRCKLFL